MSHPPVVLSIAGFDPSSGAGITADIKTIAAHHCYGITCITGLTVQSTLGVRSVRNVDPETVSETLHELAADFEIAAVRIGMLASGAVATAVADFLERQGCTNVVLDPIVRSTSGATLLNEDGIAVVKDRLLRLALVITPNIDEARLLSGVTINAVADAERAAERLHKMGAANVVITGGHLREPVDVLSMQTADGRHLERFSRRRVESGSTHGTGCAFATAVACNLALGKNLQTAVREAGEYVCAAIESAHTLGHGKGPINHLLAMK